MRGVVWQVVGRSTLYDRRLQLKQSEIGILEICSERSAEDTVRCQLSCLAAEVHPNHINAVPLSLSYQLYSGHEGCSDRAKVNGLGQVWIADTVQIAFIS